MKPYAALRGRHRRRHLRILRRLASRGVLYVRTEHEFRMVERMHRAGVLTACVSKHNWFGGRRPFRELAVFAAESDAVKHYDRILPRQRP